MGDITKIPEYDINMLSMLGNSITEKKVGVDTGCLELNGTAIPVTVVLTKVRKGWYPVAIIINDAIQEKLTAMGGRKFN
jgi:hypothetical protein